MSSSRFHSIDSYLTSAQRRILVRENLTNDAFDNVLEATTRETGSEDVSILVEDFFRAFKKAWIPASGEKRELLRGLVKAVLAGDIIHPDQAKRLMSAFEKLDPEICGSSSEESDCSTTKPCEVKMTRIPRLTSTERDAGRDGRKTVEEKRSPPPEDKRSSVEEKRKVDENRKRSSSPSAASPPPLKKAIFQVFSSNLRQCHILISTFLIRLTRRGLMLLLP